MLKMQTADHRQDQYQHHDFFFRGANQYCENFAVFWRDDDELPGVETLQGKGKRKEYD